MKSSIARVMGVCLALMLLARLSAAEPLPAPMVLPTANPGHDAVLLIALPTVERKNPLSICQTTLRVTLDGSDPTVASLRLSDPIVLTSSTTIKVRAFAPGRDPSPVVTRTYDIRLSRVAATPVATPVSGALAGPTDITLTTATRGSVILYTTDGSLPTLCSRAYSRPVRITPPATLVAQTYALSWWPSPFLVATYTNGSTPPTLPAAPTLTPGTTTATSPFTVTAATTTAGAVIRVTNDGSEPSTASLAYSAPLTIDRSQTMKAAAFNAAGRSPVVTATYTLSVADLVATPAAGSFDRTSTVNVATSSPGVTIRWTQDGSEPTATSPVWTAPLSLSTTATLSWRAFRDGWTASPVLTGTWTIRQPTPAPTLPASATFTTDTPITVTAVPGAEIRFTTDGTAPTAIAPVLTNPYLVTRSQILTVVAIAPGSLPSAPAVATYTCVVAAPVVTPVPGLTPTPVTVAATSPTPGVTIRVTTNGTAPTLSSPLWTGPLILSGTTSFQWQAFREGWTASAVTTATYTLQPEAPVASLAAGTYVGPQTITLTCVTPAAAVHYTLDGSVPTEASSLADGPIALPGSCKLNAVATKSGWTTSTVVGVEYVLRLPPPTLAPVAGVYSTAPTVTATGVGSLHYTRDATVPTSDSPVLPAAGMLIDRSMVVTVLAVQAGWLTSEPAFASYTLQVLPPVADVAAGSYTAAQDVTLTCPTDGTVIRYTLDGSDPLDSATAMVASGPIHVDHSLTVTARALRDGWSPSPSLTSLYTLTIPTPMVAWTQANYAVLRSATSVEATLHVAGPGIEPMSVNWELHRGDQILDAGTIPCPVAGGDVPVAVPLPAPPADGSAVAYMLLLAEPIGVQLAPEAATASIQVSANQPPVPALTARPVPQATPGMWFFDGTTSSDADGRIATWTWTFADGVVITHNTAYHRFPTNGPQTVTLAVTDEVGATTITTTSITVTPLPTMRVAVEPAQISEQDGTSLFTISRTVEDASQPATVRYAWAGDLTPGAGLVLVGEPATSVTIPAGETSATIAVTATHDAQRTGARIAELVLQADDAYRIGCHPGGRPGKADLTIIDVEGPHIPADPTWYATPATPKTSFADSTRFLVAGPAPIQTGIDLAALNPDRQAVIRGKIMGRDGKPLPGVKVEVHDQEPLGYSYSRMDGVYDIVINGGENLTVVCNVPGYLTVHRAKLVRRNDWTWMPDVVMTPLSPQSSEIILTASEQWQVAKLGGALDERGYRAPTVLFPPGTTARITGKNGQVIDLDRINLRATEYTVGARGPEAMPADLPQGIGYTYCVDISSDEAIAAGATTVVFNRDIPMYVTNFMNVPPGATIPVGWYDLSAAEWVAEKDAVVVRYAIINDQLRLDINKDGVPDDEDEQLLEITTAELESAKAAFADQLGYAGEIVITRAQVNHFTPIDQNYILGPLTSQIEEYRITMMNWSETGYNGAPLRPYVWPESAAPESSAMPPVAMSDGRVFGTVTFAGCDFILQDHTRRSKTSYHSIEKGRDFSRVTSVRTSLAVAGTRTADIQAGPGVIDKNYTWDGKDAYGRKVIGRAAAELETTYRSPSEMTSKSWSAIRKVIRSYRGWRMVNEVILSEMAEGSSGGGAIESIPVQGPAKDATLTQRSFFPAASFITLRDSISADTGNLSGSALGKAYSSEIEKGTGDESKWWIETLCGSVLDKATPAADMVAKDLMRFSDVKVVRWIDGAGLLVVDWDSSQYMTTVWIADEDMKDRKSVV